VSTGADGHNLVECDGPLHGTDAAPGPLRVLIPPAVYSTIARLAAGDQPIVLQQSAAGEIPSVRFHAATLWAARPAST